MNWSWMERSHQPAALVEIYPTLPLYSDRHKDPEQDKASCNKDLPDDSGITGVFCQISYKQEILKGATALRKGKSPGVFVRVLYKRLPKCVKASKQYLYMIMPVHAQKQGLRRYPHRLRNLIFLIDRHHLSNHTSCSTTYNINKYSYLGDVNIKKINKEIEN